MRFCFALLVFSLIGLFNREIDPAGGVGLGQAVDHQQAQFVLSWIESFERDARAVWYVLQVAPLRHGHFGEVQLDDLNLLALAAFEGNVWAGDAAVAMGLFIDESADGQQRDALQRIFAGEAGGWPAQFAALVGEFRGIEFVPITFEVADDLA